MRLCALLSVCAFPALVLAAGNATVTPDPSSDRIAAARAAIANNPKSWQPHIDLAAEFCRKARDSEQLKFYSEAWAELQTADRMSPGNYDARKVEVSILLGEGNFDAALKLASELNRKTPDDIAVWGLLAEVNAALGSYSEALRDAQWVLDLRPGSALGFVEAAQLREEFGDTEGAIEFYEEAIRRIPFGDLVQRAWLLTRMGSTALCAGNIPMAGERFESALKMNPESSVAAAGLAQVRLAEGSYDAAVGILSDRHKNVGDARTLYDLAVALDLAGRKQEAVAAFTEFESIARRITDKPENANLDLIYYYANRRPDPVAALKLAEHESTVRKDSRTLAAYAWALYVSGRYKDADIQMREALKNGYRESVIVCAAAHISTAVNDTQTASRRQSDANALRPHSCSLGLKTESYSGESQ